MGSTERRIRWIKPTLVVVVGLALTVASLGWAFADETGTPWDTSIFSSEDGSYTVTISHPDGRVEVEGFGSRADVDRFLDRRREELSDDYGLPRKALIGEVGLLIGLGLVFGGLAMMVIAGARRVLGHSRSAPVRGAS